MRLVITICLYAFLINAKTIVDVDGESKEKKRNDLATRKINQKEKKEKEKEKSPGLGGYNQNNSSQNIGGPE